MRDDTLLYETQCNNGMTHSETLLPMIDTALRACGLTMEDIDLLGVTSGPGSFTGLRIGLSVVKGLALPRQIPCAGVSTMAVQDCKKPLFFVGDGATLCYNSYKQVCGVAACPPALQVLRGAGVALAAKAMWEAGACVPPAALLPDYHRLSQAERERAEREKQQTEGTK